MARLGRVVLLAGTFVSGVSGSACRTDSVAAPTTRLPSPPIAHSGSLVPAADPAIAYVGSGGLSVMNADGSNQAVVVATSKTTTIGAGLPSWSPDAKSIVFGASINGVGGLWLVDLSVVNGTPQGSNLRKLQITCPSGASAAGGAGPAWSPSGSVIAIIAQCIQPWDGNIYVVPSGGGNATVAYSSPTGFSPEWPAWSPDGSTLVFVERGDTGTTIPRALVEFNLTTSTRTVVLPLSTSFFPKYPAWSHGGTQIAYSGYSGNNPEAIFTINASGGTPTQITTGSDPAWSADDGTLAYGGSLSRSQTGLIALTLASGATQLLASRGSNPDWRRF